MSPQRIQSLIRDVPDFPKPGIVFKDITPVLADPQAFARSIDLMAEHAQDLRPEVIAGPESRGFIFGTALARQLDLGFVPIRKPGKLPWKTRSATYELEYGTDTLEVHEDAVDSGQRVLIVDDLLATGGTMEAACRLMGDVGGEVAGCIFLVELGFLEGRKRLENHTCHSLITY